MRVVRWVAVAISFVVAGHCAALALVGVPGGILALVDPHSGVALLMVSGLVLAPLVLATSAGEASAAVEHLPPADPFVTGIYSRAVRTPGKLAVLSCPGNQPVVLRGRRRTMVLAPVGAEPSEGARRAARDLNLGQGWILPWVMRVVRFPGMYLGGFGQIRRLDADPHAGWSAAWFFFSVLCLPGAVVGWVVGQIAMLLVSPRVLAAFTAQTDAGSEDGRLGLRERLLLPFTWYGRSQQEREPFDPTKAVLTASRTKLAAGQPGEAPQGSPGLNGAADDGPVYGSPEPGGANEPATAPRPTRAEAAELGIVLFSTVMLVGALNLASSGVQDAVVWWDEHPVTAMVTEVATPSQEQPGITAGWHPEQRLTVMLPDGETAQTESEAADYRRGDSIRLAADDDGNLRAAPAMSANSRVRDVIYGFGWAALFSLLISFQYLGEWIPDRGTAARGR